MTRRDFFGKAAAIPAAVAAGALTPIGVWRPKPVALRRARRRLDAGDLEATAFYACVPEALRAASETQRLWSDGPLHLARGRAGADAKA